jgi:SAM-dependent methyltransferase
MPRSDVRCHTVLMNSDARSGLSIGESAYDAFYYQHCCGAPYVRNEAWLAFFGRIADRIVSDIRPRRVLDAGCGMGFLVESLRARDVQAFGIDLSSYAISQVHESVRSFCSQGSITDEFPDQYDLIVSIEVLEHMSASAAERAVENMCSHTADVLFTSTPLDYKEATHVNVHQPDYWVEQFGRYGFFRDVDFDGSLITPWTVRFRKRTDSAHQIARDYERRLWELMVERNELRTQNFHLHEQLKSGGAGGHAHRGLTRRIIGRILRGLAARSGA